MPARERQHIESHTMNTHHQPVAGRRATACGTRLGFPVAYLITIGVGALLAANAPAHGAEPAAPAPDLGAVVGAAAAYESGASYAPLRQLEERVRTVGSETGPRRELEAGLIKLLGPGSTYEARKFACQHLAILGTAASLPALAELLRGETTAGIACLALATHPSAQAGERLRQALPNLSGAAQLQVINTLGTRRDEAAVEALVSLAGGADAAVAQAAIVALAKIANVPARKAIAGLRRAAKPELAPALHEASLRIAESLVGLGERKEGADLYQELLGPAEPNHVRRGALAALLRLDADGGEQRIFELLARHDPILTPVAIAAVPALKSAEAVNRLARAFPSLSALEQLWLIEAMAARGDSPARNAVRAALNTEDAAVRLAAIEAVGKIDDASAVPLLRAPLDRTTSSLERTTLESALASLRGGAEADQAILAELKAASPAAKPHLVTALARRGSRAAVPAVLAEAGSTDLATARAAFKALSVLGAAEDLPAVVEKLAALPAADARAEAEAAVTAVLGKVGDASRRSDTLCAALGRAADLETRCSLLGLLPRCGGPAAFAALKAAALETIPKIRDTAIRALADWPELAAWDTLAGFYEQSESEVHRALAFRGLVRLADEENTRPSQALLERYRQLLAAARNDEHRKLALAALSGLADPGALELALSTLDRPGVRAEARQAVRKIAEAVKGNHAAAAQAAIDKLK